jgi:hypothetical protein
MMGTSSRIFYRAYINRMMEAMNDLNRCLERRMKLWPRYSSYEIFKVNIGTNNSFAANLVHLFCRRISYLVYLETIDETAYLVQKCVGKCRPKNYHFIPVIIPSPDGLIWSNSKILFDLMFQLLTTIMGEAAQKKTFSFSTLSTILFRMNLRRK